MTLTVRLAGMALAMCLAVPATAQTAQIDPDADAAARRLLSVTRMAENTEKLFSQHVAQIMGQLQQNQPDMPGRAFDILEEEFDAIAPTLVTEMLDIAVRMYADRFTAEEMRGIAEFYESDLGQKALTELRALSVSQAAQGRELGARLGRLAAERAVRRIEEEGLDKPPTQAQ